jgi:hypothetical protein
MESKDRNGKHLRVTCIKMKVVPYVDESIYVNRGRKDIFGGSKYSQLLL